MTSVGKIAVAAALTAAACSGTGTEPDPGPDYFPLDPGNTWTYAPDDARFGDPFDWTVTDRRGDTVTVARPPLGSHPGPVTLLDGERAVEILMAGSFAPLYRFDVGDTWVRRDPWECDEGSTWHAAVEPDPIVTPAGTFANTLRLERRTTANCDDAGTMMEWWAPGVGLVQWEELNYYAGGTLTFSVTAYSVD